MKIPKYQWLSEQPETKCGFCDVIYIKQNDGLNPFEAQVQLQPVSTLNHDIETNPFNQISGTTLLFDWNGASTYGQEVQLYLGSYIFRLVAGNSYSVNVVDGVNIITFDSTGLISIILGDVLNIFQDYIDPIAGTTTTSTAILPTWTFTISNVPADSFIADTYGLFYNYNTLVTTTDAQENFVYYNSALNYQSNGIATTNYYQYYETLNVNKLYYFSASYYGLSTNFGITITIDNGVDTYTFTPTLQSVAGELIGNFYTLSGGSHLIKIQITDPNSIGKNFTIYDVRIVELEQITSIDIEDCDGVITGYEFDTDFEANVDQYFYKDIFKVRFLDAFLNQFRFIFHTSGEGAEDVLTRWYEIPDACIQDQLLDVYWDHHCKFGQLEYINLPFTNNLLLTGVKIKQANDMLNSVDNVTADGRKISIYKNMQSLYEVRLHPFLADTISNLEHIFDHSNVVIDGKSFNSTDVFQTQELDNHIYTGRVDCYEIGSELIISNCCC